MGITTTLPVLVCTLIPALGGTEQGRQQKFRTSTEKYTSTTERLKGSQGHWQQIDWQQIEFHWKQKRTQERELHTDSYTERDNSTVQCKY